MKKRIQTGSFTVSLLVLIALILAGTCGYLLGTRKIQPISNQVSEILPQVSEEPEPSQDPATKDWSIYADTEMGFSIKHPKDWLVQRQDSTHLGSGKPVKELKISTPDKKYFLLMGVKPEGADYEISGRTGIGAGEFRSGGTVFIGEEKVGFSQLVYKDKVKEIFYSNNPEGQGMIKLGNLNAMITFSYGQEVDYDSLDLTKVPDVETANKILSTFKPL